MFVRLKIRTDDEVHTLMESLWSKMFCVGLETRQNRGAKVVHCSAARSGRFCATIWQRHRRLRSKRSHIPA